MAQPLYPAAPVIVPVKHETFLAKAYFFVAGTGAVMILIGLGIMGATIYGTQRTTSQILLNQPAAIQNPKKGLQYGGCIALVGLVITGLHVLIAKLRHQPIFFS